MPSRGRAQRPTDEFIATANAFPEHKAKFTALREQLSALQGYGAAVAAPPKTNGEN